MATPPISAKPDLGSLRIQEGQRSKTGTRGKRVGLAVVFLFIAAAIAGCLAVMPINGITTGAMNFQTFSHLAFAFKITPPLLAIGIVFALFMGLIGGVPPAIRAARRPVALALRAL